MDLVIGRSGCSHHGPAQLDEVLTIVVVPAGHTRSTFAVEFDVTVDGRSVATGTVTYIAVRAGKACPLPDAVSDLVS